MIRASSGILANARRASAELQTDGFAGAVERGV